MMNALDKSTRRKIFYGMALIFAVAAPLVLLYSRGYIVDLQGRDLVATGGIFVKTIQTGAKVYVDQEFSRETSFISHGALVTNLIPRRYTVLVEKDGYQPWSKVVRVSNEEVLEFRNVFLPPATVTPRVVFNARARGPARLIALAGRREIALEAGRPGQPATVYIVDPASRAARITLIKASQWAWDEQSRSFIIGRAADGRKRWYRLAVDGSTEDAVTFRGLPEGFTADRVVPHPTDPAKFYFSAGGALFLQGSASVPVPIAEQIHSYAIGRDRIYFLSRNGFFAASDLNGGDTKILGRKGLLLEEDSPLAIAISPAGDVALLDAANGLFLYQPGRDQELGLIAGNVTGIDFSANGDRMLFWDDHRLWVYWLSDNPEQPFDLARTKKQVFYSEPNIKSAFLDAEGAHIFFATDAGIRMTEVDDRASINSYDLVTKAPDAFVLDKESLILYWLEGSTLYRAEVK